MTTPKIVVAACGNAGVTAITPLIPKMPEVTFIAIADGNPNIEGNFDLKINTLLKHKIHPRTEPLYIVDLYSELASIGVGITTWNGRALADDEEIWFWASGMDLWRSLAGRGGLALVKNGVVIEKVVTCVN
ncbi:MAG TPA: hypothetical protein HPP94_09450 [Desulfuromonadales bacterium]|nr:hypothetical protein [Desulfuromonadales bacterium]